MKIIAIKLLISLQIISTISARASLETQQMILEKFTDSPIEQTYQVYLTLFSKTYELTSEEGNQRMQNFMANTNFIKQHKSQFPSLNIDETTDLPHEIWKTLNSLRQENNNRSLYITTGRLRINQMNLVQSSTVEGSAVTLAEYSPSLNTDWEFNHDFNSSGYYYSNTKTGMFLVKKGTTLAVSSDRYQALHTDFNYGNLKARDGTCLQYNSVKKILEFVGNCAQVVNQFFFFDHKYSHYPVNTGNIKYKGQCVKPTSNTSFTLVWCDGSDAQAFTIIYQGKNKYFKASIFHPSTGKYLGYVLDKTENVPRLQAKSANGYNDSWYINYTGNPLQGYFLVTTSYSSTIDFSFSKLVYVPSNASTDKNYFAFEFPLYGQ